VNSQGTQRERLLHLLEESSGEWVPLRCILALGIAQYNARFFELRRQLRPRGWRIENRTRRVGGVVHSSFRLVPPPSQGNLFEEPRAAEPASLIGGHAEAVRGL
jgi:hypothetical protein